MIARLYPEKRQNDLSLKTLSRTVTFMVTNNCNLKCKYCYEINKNNESMSFDTAKKFIDNLLSGENGFNEYINPQISPAIIIEFIGGEPLLEIDLIDKIVDYFKQQAIEKMHPWATMYRLSICSNGVEYFSPKVQKFLEKNKNMLSFSITIDGNKKLHDACRIFPDGKGSYDIAVSAAKDWIGRGNYMGSKITIAPGNLMYLYEAILHMVELGYRDIHANCIYEKGWELDHATEFYYQLKKLANYWNDNDIVPTHYLSLFEEYFFTKKEENDLTMWCGGLTSMLAVDPKGDLYPCIRFTPVSLGDSRPAIKIGNVDTGLCVCEDDKKCLKCMHSVNRRTQNNDECFYCPIATGCSDCAAYNYQTYGRFDSRATFICEMHKARALANAFFWNTYNRKHRPKQRFKINVPEEWALKIIPEEEWNYLKKLESMD